MQVISDISSLDVIVKLVGDEGQRRTVEGSFEMPFYMMYSTVTASGIAGYCKAQIWNGEIYYNS